MAKTRAKSFMSLPDIRREIAKNIAQLVKKRDECDREIREFREMDRGVVKRIERLNATLAESARERKRATRSTRKVRRSNTTK